MPVLALQYLISLKYKNFLVPVGIGLGILIGTLIGLSWEYIYLSPYSFCPSNLMSAKKEIVNIYVASVFHFIIIMTVSYGLYITKKEKG